MFSALLGVDLPTTLFTHKFENINPALQVDNNVKICHTNIIKVLGVVERDEAMTLVYRFEVNGSLDYWLHQREGGR
uniref:Uncharacterized protein n=1 Tax=Aegilops tauschii subsp. strangulata TaxID=200361 RepID=A0A453JD72_AEGTS